MSAARRAGRSVTAILAAYVLVLQAILAGLSGGAMAAAAAGAAGSDLAPICRASTSGAAVPAGPDGTSPHGFPNCCILGCTMAGGLVPPPPGTAIAPPVRTASRPAPLPLDLAGPRPPAWSPQSARAPPV